MTPDPRIERAIRDHLSLAQAIAWRYVKRLPKVEPDEILSVAYEGLCQAGAKWIPYCEARGFSPWSQEDPGTPEAHFGGYVAKTVNGHILDWCRRQDHVTRAMRGKIKAIQVAEADGARSEDELAAVTGLTAEKVREAQAAGAVNLVSLDSYSELDPHSAVADDGPGTEAQAEMHATLAGFMAVLGSLDAETRVILAMRYYAAREFADIAEALRTTRERVAGLHDAAVLAVHAELLRRVVSVAA